MRLTTNCFTHCSDEVTSSQLANMTDLMYRKAEGFDKMSKPSSHGESGADESAMETLGSTDTDLPRIESCESLKPS